MMQEWSFGPAAIRLILGDITKIEADVIVNAANSGLRGGGGVDGAIHRAGGPSLMLELNLVRPRGGCPPGSAVATGAGDLPAKRVIHAVGPVWRGGGYGEEQSLRRAYESSLRLAAEGGARRVSFPSLSTGAYGYPVAKAAPAALDAVAGYLRGHQTSIVEVLFVLFSAEALGAYSSAMARLAAGGVQRG